jgi:uncharacterized protein YjfI (DUF2170 family)
MVESFFAWTDNTLKCFWNNMFILKSQLMAPLSSSIGTNILKNKTNHQIVT